jgi:hypothetical protein
MLPTYETASNLSSSARSEATYASPSRECLMTVAIGMVLEDRVLLYADTLYSDGYSKDELPTKRDPSAATQ